MYLRDTTLTDVEKGLPVEFSQELAFNSLRKDGCFPLVLPPLGEITEREAGCENPFFNILLGIA
jgi:hypothetical protein